jgi:hypothetical protein
MADIMLSGALPLSHSGTIAPGDTDIFSIAVPSGAVTLYLVPETVSGVGPLQHYGMKTRNTCGKPDWNCGGTGTDRRLDPEYIATRHEGIGHGVGFSGPRTVFCWVRAAEKNNRSGGYRLMVVAGSSIPDPP